MEFENEIIVKYEGISACRTCLATNLKLFDLQKSRFSRNFSALTGIQLLSEDNLPHYICTYCHYQLRKLEAFRARCHQSQVILNQLQKQCMTSANIIKALNKNDTRLNLTKTSIQIIKIPTEHIDIKHFEVFTLKPLDFRTDISENEIISSVACDKNSSIEMGYKSDFNNSNELNGNDDDDYLINVKYSKDNHDDNIIDIKGNSGNNKNKTVRKEKVKKKEKIKNDCNKLKTSGRSKNYINKKAKSRKRTIIKNTDSVLCNQSGHLKNDNNFNSINDETINAHFIKMPNDDIKCNSDTDSDVTLYNDAFTDDIIQVNNSIFVNDNEDKQQNGEVDFIYNNINKATIKKAVKRQKSSRKKTENVKIIEENLEIGNCVSEFGVEIDNSKSDIKKINKRNTKEKNSDSKSILPEFMSLFAKPKNDNFFSKENMGKFSKEYQVEIILLSKEDQIKELESRKNTTSYIRADYKCESCYKGFVIESSYKSHIVFHDESRGAFACDICAFRYSTKRQVLTHHRQTHAVNFVCNICGHATKNIKRAKFHYNHHQGAKITCKHCGKQFTQRAQHMEHVRTAHGSARCDICGMLFISATGVSRHKFWQHKEVIGANCELCSAQFHSTEALNKHQETECSTDLKPCPTCGGNFSSQEILQTHIEDVHWKTENAFKCSKCPKTYSSEKILKIHLREHRRSQRAGEGVTPSYMCEVCGRSFMDRKYLRDHQRLHSGDKPYQCQICSKTFRLLSTHRAHMDRHANLRRYQCPLCPKTFTQAGHRAAHVRRHTNEKPYACSTCGRRFSCSGNARHHLRAVHMGIRRSRKPASFSVA